MKIAPFQALREVKVGREQRIPFEITADPFHSEQNMRYLEKMVSDIRTGQAHFSPIP